MAFAYILLVHFLVCLTLSQKNRQNESSDPEIIATSPLEIYYNGPETGSGTGKPYYYYYSDAEPSSGTGNTYNFYYSDPEHTTRTNIGTTSSTPPKESTNHDALLTSSTLSLLTESSSEVTTSVQQTLTAQPTISVQSTILTWQTPTAPATPLEHVTFLTLPIPTDQPLTSVQPNASEKTISAPPKSTVHLNFSAGQTPTGRSTTVAQQTTSVQSTTLVQPTNSIRPTSLTLPTNAVLQTTSAQQNTTMQLPYLANQTFSDQPTTTTMTTTKVHTTTTAQASIPISTSTTLAVRTTTKAAKKPVLVTGMFFVKKMYRDLLTGYETRVRPVQNQSKPVYVNTKFVPMALIDFDDANQKLSMMAYMRIHWVDEQIIWKPSNYAGRAGLRASLHEVWTPNVVLHKSFCGKGGVGNADTDILMISWDGFVQWVPEATYSVVCEVNIQYFPFDEQTCIITYYAADETTTTLELDHYLGLDMSEYTDNPSWIVVAATRKRYVKNNNWHVDVEFRFQRRANFATFTLVIPLMTLTFLNVCVFLVPIKSGEKGAFSITIFLSYGIFFTVVSDSLPHNSLQVSFFIVFIVMLLCVSVISVFYTVLQAKIIAAVGQKQCPIHCFRRQLGNNRVKPTDQNLENGLDGGDEGSYTWEDFLGQLDTYFFVLSLFIFTLITAIFFAILVRHIASPDEKFDVDPASTIRTTHTPSVAQAR